MTVFWIVAAILIVVALLFVLPPLWRKSAGAGEGDANRTLNVAVYRDQLTELEADRRAGTLSDEQYERARLELERRLLEDVAAAAPETARSTSRAPAVVVGIAVPVLAVGLYFAVGTPRALAPLPAASPHGAGAGKPPSAEQVEAMVAKLAERMKQNLESLGGLVFSQRVLLALTQAGVSREDAYRIVQRNAMKVWEGNGRLQFMGVLKKDKEVSQRLPVKSLKAIFDYGPYISHAGVILRRAFA